MAFWNWTKGLLVITMILLVCFPVTFIITIVTSPFWLWVEQFFQIEAFGHSGPAEWCYLLIYGLIVTTSFIVLFNAKKS